MTTDRVLLIINVVETVVLILQFVLLNKQIKISRKEINQGYEKERREKTVEYLFQWSEAVNNDINNLAIPIVDALDEKQCKMLYDGVPFMVSGDLITLVNKMCDVEKLATCKTNGNSLIVDGEVLFALRSSTIKVLNALENIMLAWQMKIVDTNTIENEFKSYVDYASGKMILYNFRNITHNLNSYPAIKLFCQEQLSIVNKERKNTQITDV